jgi:hypothetical protein
MSTTKLTLFNPLSSSPELAKQHSLAQETVFYGESRFRSILITFNQADDKKKKWMTKSIHQELVGNNSQRKQHVD